MDNPWVLLGLVFALGLQSGQPPRSVRPSEENSFLRIDGTGVSLDEFVEWLLEVEGEHQAGEFARRTWAVDREARRLGIGVADEEVEGEVDRQVQERVVGAFRGRRDEWLAELERLGHTERGVRRQRFVETRPELQARAIAARDRVVPEQLIRREWELRHGRHGHRYDLSMMRFQVVVPSRPDMGREEWNAGRTAVMEEGRKRALAARDRVLAGEDFGLVASRASDDPDTRDHRGIPSNGFRDPGWPASFLDAVEALAPGEVSQPIFGKGGWWLVLVRKVDTTPLESVRRGIEADLVARGPEPYEVGLVFDRVAEGLHVEVLPALFQAPAHEEWPGAAETVMRIDGEPVTRGEYARWLVDSIGETYTETFAEEWLVRKRAREAGIVADEAVVAARTHEFIASLVDQGYHGDRTAWVAYLELGGRSEESFVRRIERRTRVDLLTEGLFLRDRVVRPEDLTSRFKREFGEDGVRREVRLIQCAIRAPEMPPGLSREDLQARMDEASTEARRRAEALVARLRAGEDFAALARATSDDAGTRDAGGAVPDRFRADRWPQSIASAVEALAPLAVTDPLLHGNAWYVFQLASERRVKFDEVRDQLEREARTARPDTVELAGYRNQLAKEARIEGPAVSAR